MKNKENWFETKFITAPNGYHASNDNQYVNHGSRLIATIQAKVYPPIIQSHAKGDLLDLGCGNVPLYGVYKDFTKSITCADWMNTSHKNEYLDHQIDLNSPIPLESDSFDTILMSDVLEHIQNPELLMGEVSRMLRPGGKLILTVPFFYWLHESPYDYFRYTEYALKLFCERADLTIIELQPYGGVPEILLDIVGKCINRQKLAKLYSKLAIQLWNSNLIHKVSKNTQNRFPLGYCLVAQK